MDSSEFESKKDFADNKESNLPDVQETPELDNFYSGSGGGDNKKVLDNQDEDNRFSERFLGVKDLMAISLKMLKERIWKFICVFASILVLFFIVGAFFFFPVLLSKNLPDFSFVWDLSVASLFILALVFFLFGNFVLLQIVGDKDMRVKDAFKKAFSKIAPCLKAFLAYLAIFFAVLSPLIILGIIYALIVAIPISNYSSAIVAYYPVLTIVNLIMSILILVLLILFIPGFMLFYVLRSFLFFPLVIENKPVTESIAYVYGIIKHNTKGILWRTFAFMVLYIAMLSILGILYGINSTGKILAEFITFVLGLWMMMFSYAMYKNLKMLSGIAVDAKDIKTVITLIRTGVVAVIICILSMLFIITVMPDYLNKNTGLENQSASSANKQTQAIDSDGDGISDAEEKQLGTDPKKKDSDSDGLSDYEEAKVWQTNPLRADTDGDGHVDGEEVAYGYDPLGSGELNDNISLPAVSPHTTTGSWIYDVCPGIGVYSVDIVDQQQWKFFKTACVAPQCDEQVASNDKKGALADDNSVNFSVYPARNACKSIGGRLPAKDELLCIYNHRDPLGSFNISNDYGGSFYWSGWEYFSGVAWYVDFSNGDTAGTDVWNHNNIRCVKDK